ncbi:MAG: hydrolase family protein [Eubacterium sp.]|jgi:lysophospholipase L1-like esterase|nr:hydrolase family protein [Eubacterium sp.]
MAVLETYEWCDFWWEKTDCYDKPRVLLIGDSVTRAYRPKVNELLKEAAYVDMLATSKAVDNPSLMREIGYILSHRDFRYKVIHFNNGIHGLHLSEEEYQKGLEEVVSYIIDNCRAAGIILALSTPVTVEGKKEVINAEFTDKLIDRNNAMKLIANKYNIAIDDLYTPMFGKSGYRADDGLHYNDEGENAQAKLVAEKIMEFL